MEPCGAPQPTPIRACQSKNKMSDCGFKIANLCEMHHTIITPHCENIDCVHYTIIQRALNKLISGYSQAFTSPELHPNSRLISQA